MPVKIALCLLAALVTTALGDPHQVRRWTGKNGKTFTGAYMGADKATGKYSFAFADGKMVLIDPANISEDDLAWLDQQLHPGKTPKTSPVGGPNAKAGDPIHFLPDPVFDRSTLPVIDQANYGSDPSDCIPSAFCSFLLWWDQLNYLPIDKKGGFDRKAEFVHTRAGRYFRTRNTDVVSLRIAPEGVQKYFARELGELATYRIRTEKDCRIENLRRYAAGANATLLEVSVYHENRWQGNHVVALSRVDAEGNLFMHTWGCKLRGKLRELKPDLKRITPSTRLVANKFEIELMNPGDLPEEKQEVELRMEIDPSHGNGLTIVAPYRYKTPGESHPPPPDPIMQPGPPSKPLRGN